MTDYRTRLKCLSCEDIIEARLADELVTCSCRAIAIERHGKHKRIIVRDGAKFEGVPYD